MAKDCDVRLSDRELEKFRTQIRPVWFNPYDKQLYYLDPLLSNMGKLQVRGWTFMESSQRTQVALDLKAALYITTYHRLNGHSFNPTFGEVMETIVREEPILLARVVAFRTVRHNEQIDRPDEGLIAGSTLLYTQR